MYHQGKATQDARLLLFFCEATSFQNSALGKRAASFISVFIIKSQTAALIFLSFLDLDLYRKMKEIEKPQTDVGKEERGRL
jgi:hypothetical protein